ncbi:hypothetical protein D8770_25855 [Methylobacterium sp. DB1607]|nr:hypothetical protein [Methylobacterium sp. DB1607]
MLRPIPPIADPAPLGAQSLTRAPLVPEALLRQHSCFIPGDTRFRAGARLRQSLWREEQGLPAGLHRPGSNRNLPHLPLGSTLQPADAARGLNFLSPSVIAVVRRSLVLREEGAMVHYDRLHRNLLSSEPLTYNLFVPLALNLDLATAIFRQLLPAFVHQVTGIRFETSPGRNDARYLNDGTAFDAALSVITPDGKPAIVFIEVKYSEGCTGPAATQRPRYDEASREAALHHDPDSPALRSTLLEQFWRLHLLAQLAVRHSVTPRAHLLVLYPQLNRRVRSATHRYAAELSNPTGSSPALTGFSALTLETFVAALGQAGAGAEAAYLHHRYLDLQPVLDLVLAEPNTPDWDPPPARAPLALLPPPSSAASTAEAVAASVVPSPHDKTSPSRRQRQRPTATATAPSSGATARQPVRKLKGKAAVLAPRTSARSPASRRQTQEVR